MSIPNDLTYEKMNNMKNMIGGSFIEYLRPNIKKKENENVLKMLELTKDKPETYLEFIAVAIFHQNFEIIKYMVEKFKITEVDTPNMKASSFFNSIIPDDSSDRINDGKDYIEIQVPFVLMSGIGGDVEIFKYLLSNKLITKKSLNGIIGLTKKYKNTFTSNIIGACAYYGKKELLEYLLQNYKKELDVNVVTVEKKSKNGKYSLLKELAGSTPTFLAISGLSSDEKTVEILKILKNFGAKFNTNDYNKDNLLHIATKTKKIKTAKYLLDELKLKNLVGESNREGYTPLSLAQHLNNDIFISYYNEKNEIDEKEIQENLKELIEDSANRVNKQSKKGKKNKKKGNLDIPSLLNSNEYQESLKVEKNSDDENNRNKLHDLLDDKKSKKKIEKKEDNDDEDDNQDEKEDEKEDKKEDKKKNKKEDKKDNSKEKEEDVKEKDNKTNKKSKPIPKPQPQSNPIVQNPVEEEEEETIIGLGKKNKRNRRRTGGNKNKMTLGGNNENADKDKEKEKEDEKEKKGTGEANEGKPKNKSKKEKRVDQEEIDQEKKRKKEELERKKKEEEEERKRKEEEERKRIEEEKEKELQRKREEEEKEKQREEQRKKEEQQRKKEEQKRKREEKKRREEEQKKREEEERIKREEEERRRKEEEEERKRKEEEERRRKEEEEEEKSEKEEQLSYSEEDNMGGENSSEKEEDNNIEYNEKDYEQLNKNYLELEKKMKKLEKEKEELTSTLTKLYLENKANAKISPTSNNEENINDLMYLANKELENKNEIINDLEEKMAMLDLTNIKNFSNEKLQKYKAFYTKNLNLIKDALK